MSLNVFWAYYVLHLATIATILLCQHVDLIQALNPVYALLKASQFGFGIKLYPQTQDSMTNKYVLARVIIYVFFFYRL
jgi:hypothetical protein